jgi:transcriptional regulator with XRE-family HTH domain
MFSIRNMCSELWSIVELATVAVSSGIGERLEQVRRTDGASQADFAASIGVSRTTLHNYVKNESEVPAPVLAKLLELYRVDPLWLLDGDEGMKNRETTILDEVGVILADVEARIEERRLHVGRSKRWMIVCRLYAERVAAFRKTGIRPDLQTLGLDTLLDVAA